MSEEKKTPRWLVWLWTTVMEAATGATVVAGAVFILAIGFIWIWGIVDGPPPIRWTLITMVLLTGLVLIGRWVDRRERRVAPVPQVPTEIRIVNGKRLCAERTEVDGYPVRCELTPHSIEGVLHQASRPNGRWVWGLRPLGPQWLPDDHQEDKTPPPEPFSWYEYNRRSRPQSSRRTDETRP